MTSNLRLDTFRTVVSAAGGQRQPNEPTTGTPNLRWSVARLDALKLVLLHRHMTLAEIAKAYGSPVQEIIRLCHEMAVTVHLDNKGRKV